MIRRDSVDIDGGGFFCYSCNEQGSVGDGQSGYPLTVLEWNRGISSDGWYVLWNGGELKGWNVSGRQ